MKDRSGPKLHIKLFYGLGDVGEGAKSAALETFLFFYYIQVLGLSGSLVGLALLVALLVDAFTDPMVGSWSDKCRTRLGRRHPFLYAAPIPLAIALYLLFAPPALTGIGLALWLCVFSIIARFAMTLYFVPHMALTAELTESFAGRIALGGYRTFFGIAGRMLIIALGFAVFFQATSEFPNGQFRTAAYTELALATGLVVIAAVLISALGTQRAALATRAITTEQTKAEANTFSAMGQAFRSRSFRAFFISLLIMYIYAGVQSALALHMNTYFWGLPPEQIEYMFYASMLGFLVGIPLAQPVANATDKKTAYIIGIAGSVVFSSAPTILRLLGIMPENGTAELFIALLLSIFVSGVIGALPVVLSAAMLADLTDEYDANHKSRSEGLFFGANAFCRKAALGVGGAVAGALIDLIRFPTEASPTDVSPEMITRLGLVYAPAVLLLLIIGLVFMWPYDLSRKRHQSILATLNARDTEATN